MKTAIVSMALLVFALSGCKEVLPKSDFAKFAECFQKASENNIISKAAAKTACSAKYSKFKDINITGTGGFSFCEKDTPCGNFEINIRNPSQKTVVTRIEVVVRSKGRAVSGFIEEAWLEPGKSYSGFVTLSGEMSPEDRKDMTWSIPTVQGIDIDA